MLKEDRAYDRLPNFTAADIVQCLGIGRNEYIAMHNQVKGRKLMCVLLRHSIVIWHCSSAFRSLSPCAFSLLLAPSPSYNSQPVN